MTSKNDLTVLELCAGAGGQAIGLHDAGFRKCLAAVELDDTACETLAGNKLDLPVRKLDVKKFDASEFRGQVDLLAAGVPCPPFSIAGKQLGADDERDLFPSALRCVSECGPRAVLFENVRGFASAKFTGYRDRLQSELFAMGYVSDFRVLQASDFGVPQLRPRFVLVAIRAEYAAHFFWPAPTGKPPTVADKIADLMGANGWRGLAKWKVRASSIAPTLVGGSKKHGGPDLGPTRAKQRWKELGVNGHGIGNEAPERSFPADGLPKLTVEMAALLQGFPIGWKFSGGKTAAYRQVGNAFPPPVAKAVGKAIREALQMTARVPSDTRRMPTFYGLNSLALPRRSA